MGMFTSILYDNKEYQIKCGYDLCETFNVGDKVNQYPSPYIAGEGYLLDGIYSAVIYPDDECLYYVIIKDSIVQPIQKFSFNKPKEDNWDEYWEAHDIFYSNLLDKFPINSPPREFWTEEAWKRKEEIERQLKQEQEEYKKELQELKENYSYSPEKLIAAILANPLKKRIDYASVAEKMCQVEPMTLPEALIVSFSSIYENDTIKVDELNENFEKISDIYNLPENGN